jgi:hypothetical protein
VRLSVGKEPADASARRLRKEAELNAPNNGVAVMPENGDSGHRSLAAAIAEFLDETKLTKKPKTVAAYTTALNYFTESCLNSIAYKRAPEPAQWFSSSTVGSEPLGKFSTLLYSSTDYKSVDLIRSAWK